MTGADDPEVRPARLFTVKEIAARWRVSAKVVYDLLATSRLSHLRIGGPGGSYRIRGANILEFEARALVKADLAEDDAPSRIIRPAIAPRPFQPGAGYAAGQRIAAMRRQAAN